MKSIWRSKNMRLTNSDFGYYLAPQTSVRTFVGIAARRNSRVPFVVHLAVGARSPQGHYDVCLCRPEHCRHLVGNCERSQTQSRNFNCHSWLGKTIRAMSEANTIILDLKTNWPHYGLHWLIAPAIFRAKSPSISGIHLY